MKKKSMRQKKSGTIRNKDVTHSFWCIGKNMKMNMISGQLKWDYYMPKRQLKTIGQEFQVEIY